MYKQYNEGHVADIVQIGASPWGTDWLGETKVPSSLSASITSSDWSGGWSARSKRCNAFRRSYANTLNLPDPTSLFIRTHLFPNPARAGRCTSGGRAGRLRAALEAVLRLVEVALDLVGGDLDTLIVAHARACRNPTGKIRLMHILPRGSERCIHVMTTRVEI